MEVLCGMGSVLALLCVLLTRYTRAGGTCILFVVMWLLYLNLFLVGQTFLSFQWDILLLEAGGVAMFITPLNPSSNGRYGRTRMWLPRFILFKLMLMSGVVKVTANCETWSNLTALTYHFATQCIPTPLAFYFHHLPLLLQKWSVAITLSLEGPMTFLLLSPFTVARVFGAYCQILLQLLIMATGNYNFFNLLTIALAVTCLHDGEDSTQHEKKPSSGIVMRSWRVIDNCASAVLVLMCYNFSYMMFDHSGQGYEDIKLAIATQDVNDFLKAALPPTVKIFFFAILPLHSLVDLVGDLKANSNAFNLVWSVLKRAAILWMCLYYTGYEGNYMLLTCLCRDPLKQNHSFLSRTITHTHT